MTRREEIEAMSTETLESFLPFNVPFPKTMEALNQRTPEDGCINEYMLELSKRELLLRIERLKKQEEAEKLSLLSEKE